MLSSQGNYYTVTSVFENQLQSWSTHFGFLPPFSPLSEFWESITPRTGNTRLWFLQGYAIDTFQPRELLHRNKCFWEWIAKLVDGFWILPSLFAAFRNCTSVRSNFTAQAHLWFPLSDNPVNRETSQGKPGKYHTWVGRQKRDGQKSAKSLFTGFANHQKRAADDSNKGPSRDGTARS